MNKIEIKNYGYNDYFKQQANQYDHLIPARIIAVFQGIYDVVCENGMFHAKLKGNFSYHVANEEDYPTVGDFVMIQYRENSDILIEKVLKRYAILSRKAPNDKHKETQIIGANIDYAFIVMSLNHDFNPARVERYLTAIYQGGITPVIVLSKADLCLDVESYVVELEQVAMGVDIIVCSVINGTGMERFEQYMQKGKTVVFVGSSGVGKSSLLNALAHEEIMTVNTIREDDDKGRHTTTHRQLILLNQGAMIIDTPGMREFGMINVEDGLNQTFSDIYELAQQCKFKNCVHESEPGCAVKKAIETGELSLKRFNQYKKLLRVNQYYANKSVVEKSAHSNKKNGKELAKQIRKIQNNTVEY